MTDDLMTVGDLAQRTGMTARLIRRLTDLGLIYSAGRSPANYRLYDESALWCIDVISRLRDLGLTIDEIHRLGRAYLDDATADIGFMLYEMLGTAAVRLDEHINHLIEVRARQDSALGSRGNASALTLPPDPTRA